MKEWFKARLIWKGAFDSLSDAEAGRLAKALWAYAADGTRAELTGKEIGAYGIIIETLNRDAKDFEHLSSVRSAVGRKGRQVLHDETKESIGSNCKQLVAKEAIGSNCKQKETIDSNCKQKETNQAIASKSDNKNKNKDKDYLPPIIPPLAGEELSEIQKDHDEIFDAMKYTGFEMTPAMMDAVIDLYSEHGKENVLEGIKACVGIGNKLAYLRKVLQNKKDQMNPIDDNKTILTPEEWAQLEKSIVW